MADDFREQPVFLSTVPAERSDHRGALVVVVLSLLVFVAVVPFARTQLPQTWPFVPIYQSTLAINDLITAALLYAQFAILRSRALLVLASGYLFTAVLAVVHMLTFPGLFSPTGLLGAGPQTTAWLYFFWHSVFPLAVIAYALMKERIGEPKRPARPLGRTPILSSVAGVLVVACALTLLATAGQDLLPSVMQSNSYAPIQVLVSGTVWMFSVVALPVLWLRRPHSKLDLWLMAVMCAWIFDVALSALFNAGRFDLGFYAGRIYGVLAATFVLLVLLLEMNAVYFRFARSLWAEQEERKREMEERRNFFETSLDLIYVVDSRGIFVRVSPSSAGTLGYRPEEMIGRSAIEFIYPDDLEATRNEMRLARHGHKSHGFEARYVHKSGRVVSLAWTGVWSEAVQRYFFIGRDMTERKAAETRLNHLAHYDQLTGLLNRISLESVLEELLEPRTGQERRPTAIAMVDLDGFKDINDTLGHSVGDHVLKEVAQRLTAFTGDGARVYRFGGDEFVVTFPEGGDPRAVARAVDGMLARLAERYEADGRVIFVGASAGIAIGPADGSSVGVLLANADLALYEAKAHGGGTYRQFRPALRAQAEARRELDLELRRAFSEEEFELYFQPQVRLRDGVVVGAESLLRWRHPERGIVAAEAFIEVLAESVIAREVGRWILRSACERSVAWRSEGLPPTRIGVNLFATQFHHETLLQDIEHILRETGLPADALELEITEKIGLDNDDKVLTRLQTLREMGVHFAFDDFGTGYASLSYLSRYPLTRIKIDQSFVQKISDDGQDAALVRSIIIMAHNLGLTVVAEGVETVAQARFLHAQGCEEVQGFLCAAPLPQAEFGDFLRSHQIDSPKAAEFARSILPTSGIAARYDRERPAQRFPGGTGYRSGETPSTVATIRRRTQHFAANGGLAMTVKLRAGTQADAGPCGTICYEAFKAVCTRHNFPPDFPSAEVASGLLATLLVHPRFYSVVAELDGRIVGSNFVDERSSIYGVGPITVDPTVQNRNIGARLMQDAIDRGAQSNAAGVRLLQAGFHNRSLALYTKLGFRSREMVSILQGAPLRQKFTGYEVRPAAPADVPACNRVCHRVHGFDREVELRDAIEQKTASVVEHLGRITGYTTGIAFFAHTVAETNAGLMALIGAAPEFGGPGFLLPTRNHEVLTWCLKGGLQLVFQMTLMTIGLYNEPDGAYLPSVLY